MVASNPQHSSPCKFITPVSVSFFTWCLPRVSVFLCPNSPLPVRTAILDLGPSLLHCDLTLVTSAIQIRSHSEFCMVINFAGGWVGGDVIQPMGCDYGGGSGDGMMMVMVMVAVW